MTNRSMQVAVIVLVTLGARVAAADDFDDFRIPAHHHTDWTATLDADGDRDREGTSRSESRRRRFEGGGGTELLWFSDSDPRTTRLRIQASGLISGDWESGSIGALPGPSNSTQDQTRGAREQIVLSLFHRFYPGNGRVGLALSSFALGSYQQAWEHNRLEQAQDIGGARQRGIFTSSRQSWRYFPLIQNSASAGVGRVRDASGIYEARLIEERLQSAGALRHPLSAGARQKLAALLTVRGDYESFRDRPEKTLWQRVEEILVEDGALAEGGLDARSILRVGESFAGFGNTFDDLPRSPFARRVGWFAGPTLADQHQRFIERSGQSSSTQVFSDDSLLFASAGSTSTRFDQAFDLVLLGFGAEVHRPLGLAWQADASARVLLPVQPHRSGVEVTSSGALDWMVADRWVAAASFAQSRHLLHRGGDVLEDDWSWFYGVSLSYFLEDHLQVTLATQEVQDHLSFGVDDIFDRSGHFSLSIGYRILGRFGAPGLIAAEAIGASL